MKKNSRDKEIEMKYSHNWKHSKKYALFQLNVFFHDLFYILILQTINKLHIDFKLTKMKRLE